MSPTRLLSPQLLDLDAFIVLDYESEAVYVSYSTSFTTLTDNSTSLSSLV